MKFAATSATALALLFALSACGGGAEDSEAAPAETPVAADAAPVAAASEAPVEAATPEPEPSETAAAAPAPTPSPAATRAAAPVAVAVAEPAAFAMCKACHSVEPGKNGIGPSLAGIWGEKAGAVPGFDFSDAMKDSGLVWNEGGLDRYLADPRGVVAGTKMAFGGVKDAARRQEIIDYIKGL